MHNSLRPVRFAVLVALWASAAGAQTPATTPAQSAPSQSSDDSALRFSTTTADGDTGLWYVPTADVLGRGKWSASGYRVGTNYKQGFTNVADFPITFAYGISDHVELFASWKVITRIDRDLRPLFGTDPDIGGVINRYPKVKQGWSGNALGDFLVGGKFNLMNEADGKPASLAVRGSLKLAIGDEDSGASTGKTDGVVDFVV